MKKIITIILITSMIFTNSSFVLLADSLYEENISNEEYSETNGNGSIGFITENLDDNKENYTIDKETIEAEIDSSDKEELDNEEETKEIDEIEEDAKTDEINEIDETNETEKIDETEKTKEIEEVKEVKEKVEIKETIETINKKTDEIEDIIINEDDIATVSQIDCDDSIVATESEIEIDIIETDIIKFDDNVSTTSEIKNYDIISTSSITNKLYGLSTISEIIKVATYSDINYIFDALNVGGDSAKIENSTITILKNININKTIVIKDSMILDLNNYNITSDKLENLFDIDGTDKKETINVTFTSSNYNENSIYLDDKNSLETNNIKSNFESNDKSNQKALINLKNANFTISNIQLRPTHLNSALYVNNSNVTINNGAIFGGRGVDFTKNSNGSEAINISWENDKYKLVFNSGVIKGGEGAKNNLDAESNGGATLSIGRFSYKLPHSKNGLMGSYGCGSGGSAIIINDNNYTKNIIVNDNGIEGGDGGQSDDGSQNDDMILSTNLLGDSGDSVVDSQNELFGDSTLPSYYDLRIPSNVGTTYTNVSGLKNQEDTGLCAIFSTIAASETSMMKNKRSYLDKYFANDNDYMTTHEAKFSEAHLMYYMYTHQTDPLGNAGASKTTLATESILDAGFDSHNIMLQLAKTGVVSDSKVPSQPIELLKNNTLTQNSPYATDYVAKLKTMTYYDVGGKSVSEKVNILKNAIKKHGGVKIAVVDNYEIDTPDLDDLDTTAVNWYNERYGTYANTEKIGLIREKDASAPSAGGHAMFIVGWDDDFDKNMWPSAYRPSENGAFIIKNSWGIWTYMSYEFDFKETDGVFGLEMTTPEENQHIYYYDSGNNLGGINSDTDWTKIANVFTIKGDNELLKAITYPQFTETNAKVNINIYKIPNGKTINDIKDSNKVARWNGCKLTHGLNYFDFSSLNILLKKGETYAIVFDIPNNFAISIDNYAEYDSETYETTFMNKSYAYVNGSFKLIKDAAVVNFNLRIKMITQDAYTIDFDAAGGNAIKSIAVSKTDNTITIKDKNFTKFHYIFMWFVDDNNNIYKIGDKITVTKNMKLKAEWSYDAGGKGGPSDIGGYSGSGDGSKTIYDNVNENLNMSKVLSASDNTYKGNWIYNPTFNQWSFYITGIDNSGVILSPTANNSIDINTNNTELGMALNGWYLISSGRGTNDWYYFSNGIMSTGLIVTNGNTYFCETDKSLPSYGAMQKGNKIINNVNYYFDEYGKLKI